MSECNADERNHRGDVSPSGEQPGKLVPKYKLVIFDFDGTLADSFPVFLDAWKDAADRYGFKSVAEIDIDRLRGCSAREIIAEIGLPYWKLPSVTRHMRELMRAKTDRVALFDGMEMVLRSLKDIGIKIAIVTSNSRENVEQILGKENLGLVDHFSCGASVFGKKPGTRSIWRASGASSKEVLCVGDEIRDADVARELGLDFAAVSWGYTKPEQLACLPGVKMCKNSCDILSLAGV